MRKKLLLFFGSIFVLLLLGVSYLYVRHSLTQSSNNSLKVTFSNENLAYLPSLTLDTEKTAKILKVGKLDTESILLWQTTKRVTIQQLNVILTPVPQKDLSFTDDKGNPTLAFGQTYDDTKQILTIRFYVSPSEIDRLTFASSLEETLSYSLLHFLITQQLSTVTSTQNDFLKIQEEFAPQQVKPLLKKYGNIFIRTDKRQAAPGLIQRIKSLFSQITLVPTVYAGCTGSFTCETTHGVHCTCSADGSSCGSPGGTCGAFDAGTCGNCTYDCQAGATVSCASFACSPNCSGPCSNGTNSCVYTPPPPPPTSTPRPVIHYGCWNGSCVSSSSGPYTSSSCNGACATVPPAAHYKCDTSSYSCSSDPTGPYTDATSCADACKKPEDPCANGACDHPKTGCMDEHDCGDITTHDCCNGQCVPEGTQCGGGGCERDAGTTYQDVWFRVVSDEDDQTVAWKGSKENDPVIYAERTSDGANVTVDNPNVPSWSVDGLDSDGYFQRYNAFQLKNDSYNNVNYINPDKTFDKTKNRIDPSMNLTITQLTTGAISYYDGCETLTNNIPSTPAVDEHWSNHFCGEGLAASADRSNNAFIEKVPTGCGHGLERFAVLNTTNCSTGDDSKIKYWPNQDVDGCVSINELGGGGKPSENGGKVSTNYPALDNLLRYANPRTWSDLRFDEYWSMNTKVFTKYIGFEGLTYQVKLVPPSGYHCDNVTWFTADGAEAGHETQKHVGAATNVDGSCAFKFGSRKLDASLFLIEIARNPINKSCAVELEDFINNPNQLKRDLTIDYGTPFNAYVTGSSNQTRSPQTEPVQLWLEKEDFTHITAQPFFFTEFINKLGQYYYLYNSPTLANGQPSDAYVTDPIGAAFNRYTCFTNDGLPCDMSATVNELTAFGEPPLPVGKYNLHCQMPTAPYACSGNPFCSWNGGSWSCTGWEDCTPDVPGQPTDHASLTVQCKPQCDAICSDGNTDNGCNIGVNCPRGTGYGDLSAPDYGYNKINGNYTMSSSNMLVQFSISAVDQPKVNQFELLIFPKGTYNDNPADAQVAWEADHSTTSLVHQLVDSQGLVNGSFSFIPTTDFYGNAWRDLNIAVRSIGKCNQKSPWATDFAHLVATVNGNFVQDDAGNCSADRNNLINPGLQSGSTLTFTNGSLITSMSVENLSSYLMGGVAYAPNINWGINLATLHIINTDVSQAYVCSQCGGSIIQSKNCSNGGRDCLCQRSGFRANYTLENADFYLQKYNLSNGPWWQTIGGLAYATDGMTSKIPDTCTGSCRRNLMLALFIDPNSAGIPIVDKLATIITGVGVGGFYTEHQNNPRVQSEAGYTNTHQQSDAKPQENYAYFRKLVDVSVPDSSNGSTTNINVTQVINNKNDFATVAHLSPQSVPNDPNTFVVSVPGNLSIYLPQAWNIPAGEKWIIFVPGNLTIDGNTNQSHLIQVAEGGFLAFIVKNDITFSSSLGYYSDAPENETTPVVDGVFIANHDIVVASKGGSTPDDNKFVGAGTFVGWNNVKLERNFEDPTGIHKARHNLSPTELFIHRPDFVVNTPAALLRPATTWKEVN